MKLTSLTLLALLPLQANAFDYSTDPNITQGVDTDNCYEFFDTVVEDTLNRNLVTICRMNYAVVYDLDCKIPLLAFESLTPDELDGTEPRKDSFKADPSLLDEHSAQLEDYYKSGYDRGHMVPAGDMKEDSTSMEQSFYLSNIIPQNPTINRGYWKKVEQRVRDMVIDYGNETFVVTGAVVTNDTTIGNDVCVPSYTFKMVYQGDIHLFAAPNSGDTKLSKESVIKNSGFIFYR